MEAEAPHRPLCMIELIAEGRAGRCPGEACPYWENGCCFSRNEADLDGRKGVAELLLDVRRELENCPAAPDRRRARALSSPPLGRTRVMVVTEAVTPVAARVRVGSVRRIPASGAFAAGTVDAARALDGALVRLHAAQARALHVLRDAERSLVAYEHRLGLRKARLHRLGFSSNPSKRA